MKRSAGRGVAMEILQPQRDRMNADEDDASLVAFIFYSICVCPVHLWLNSSSPLAENLRLGSTRMFLSVLACTRWYSI
jgi:hypothetical protein